MSNENDIYRLLQQHLDNQAVGFPSVESGADITLLKRLFSQDEVRLALHISYKPTSLERIEKLAASEFSPEKVAQLLDSMLMKGAIGRKGKNGVVHWHVMPLIVGMYEHQDGVPTTEFLTDMFAYAKTEEFGKALLKVAPSQMRTIPINRSIEVEHHIAHYDQIREIVRNARGPFVVCECICRKVASMNEEPCGITSRLETCLALNDFAAVILHRNHGRQITRDEALKILQQNEDDGLVLQPENSQTPQHVCSCCGCCCGMLKQRKSLPRPVDFWTSNFRTIVYTAACSKCGKCVSRCQVNAITLTGPAGKARIDDGRCIGCGLCVPVCQSNALMLKKKSTQIVPPQNDEALYDKIMANKNNSQGGW